MTDNGDLACGVFVDLQKAVDTVDHSTNGLFGIIATLVNIT